MLPGGLFSRCLSFPLAEPLSSSIRAGLLGHHLCLSHLWLPLVPFVVCSVAQSCPTLCGPMDCSPPVSSVLPMKFSTQEYLSELPFPSPGDLPDPGIKPMSPILQADSLPSESPGNPNIYIFNSCSVTYVFPGVRDPGSIPGWGRSPGEENGYPLQYSCLENSTDRGAWWLHSP